METVFTKNFSTASLVCLLAAAAILTGCTNSRMASVKATETKAAPKANEATVVFYRPARFRASAVLASIFEVTDGEPKFVGNLSNGNKVAYHVATDRKLRFMVTGRSADFIDAHLSPQKTYFARVDIALRKGAVFSLRPVSADSANLETQLERTAWVENTLASRQWAIGNMVIFEDLLAYFLPIWKMKSSRPALSLSDGR